MKKTVDYLIIGAGPAGLQLGYFLQKNNCDYLILEKGNAPGGFFKQFPRHGKLISTNKVYTGYDDPEVNLRWDWNSLLSNDYSLLLKKFSKEYFPSNKVMMKYLHEFAKKFKLKVKYRAEVKKINKPDSFVVKLADGTHIKAERIIIATGMAAPYLPQIPGMEKVDNYANMSLNKRAYRNQRVLIIGKGNSAFETADHIIEEASLIHMASPNPIRFAWKSHHVGDLRAVNNNLLDTYQLKSQNALINAGIKRIDKRGGKYQVQFAYTLANDEVETIEYDHVIACTGFVMNLAIFGRNCKPEASHNNRLPALTSWYESQNIEDLYFAGVLMQDRDYKKKQSSVIHGFRYNIKFLANFLAHKYENQPSHIAELNANVKAVTTAIIEHANRSSAMWQQTGYICDLLVYKEKQNKFYYYDCVPHDFMADSNFAGRGHYLTLTLEFGQEIIDKAFNTFAIERVHKKDYQRSYLSAGIHPIVRHFHRNKLVSEHHLLEYFTNEWKERIHVKPLQDYLSVVLEHIKQNKKLST